MNFGETIRREREAKGLRIRDLAEQVGVSFATIARWETGTRRPGLMNLHRLSQALGVSMSDLLKAGDSSPESIIPQ